jgi:hypothetical protein
VNEVAAFIDDFCADGFLVLRGAVAPDVVRACRNVIEEELRALAVDRTIPQHGPSPSSALRRGRIVVSGHVSLHNWRSHIISRYRSDVCRSSEPFSAVSSSGARFAGPTLVGRTPSTFMNK